MPTITPIPIPVLTESARFGYGELEQVAWSPDGKLLAATSSIGIYLFDATTLAQVKFIDTGARLGAIAYSPDGKTVAVGRYDEVQLRDVETGELVRSYPGNSWAYGLREIIFTPDGHRMAVRADDMTRIWEVETGEILRVFDTEFDINDIDISPDGQRLATGENRNVRVWDIETGEVVYTLVTGDFDIVWSVAFSPDGKNLAVGLFGPLQIWDLETGRLFHTAVEPLGPIDNLQYSPLSQRLDEIVAYFSANALAIQLGDLGFTTTLDSYVSKAKDLAFSPDGTMLATSGDNRLQLWSVKNKELLREVDFGRQHIYQAAFGPDGRLLMLRNVNGETTLWDEDSKQVLIRFDEDKSLTSNMALSPNGRQVAVGAESDDRRIVQIWNLDNGQTEKELSLEGRVNAVVFNPDGNLLASAESYSSLVKLWDVATGQLLHTLSGHSDGVWAVAFSRDGELLASAGGAHDGTVRIWDVKTGEFLQKVGGMGPTIFAPHEDALIVYAPSGEGFRAWVADVTTGERIRELPYGCLAFAPDGQTCSTGTTLMDFETGETLYILSGHTMGISNVSFSPDGRRLVTTSYDGTVRAWDVPLP
jgi:WD40 repeat protein